MSIRICTMYFTTDVLLVNTLYRARNKYTSPSQTHSLLQWMLLLFPIVAIEHGLLKKFWPMAISNIDCKECVFLMLAISVS